MNFTLNVGGAERIFRIVIGIVLIALAYFGVVTDTGAIIAYVVGAIALATGIIKFCPVTALLGINTNKPKSTG